MPAWGPEAMDVNRCIACILFRDPDPRPAYCMLDIDRRVQVLGDTVPDNCPLLTMHVEVLERSDRKSGDS
jgi:hypothetical protein